MTPGPADSRVRGNSWGHGRSVRGHKPRDSNLLSCWLLGNAAGAAAACHQPAPAPSLAVPAAHGQMWRLPGHGRSGPTIYPVKESRYLLTGTCTCGALSENPRARQSCMSAASRWADATGSLSGCPWQQRQRGPRASRLQHADMQNLGIKITTSSRCAQARLPGERLPPG